MNTLKRIVLKAIFITALWPLGMLSLAVAQNNASSETPKYQKEKSDINADITAIQMHRHTIASLESKCRSDKMAGLEATAVVDQKELMKAKADLQRDKLYLRADKKDLMRDHNLAIGYRRDAL